MLSNISSLVNVWWWLGTMQAGVGVAFSDVTLGIPMNDTTNLRLGIAEVAESILGDRLIGLQAGNEPDLYAQYAILICLTRPV